MAAPILALALALALVAEGALPPTLETPAKVLDAAQGTLRVATQETPEMHSATDRAGMQDHSRIATNADLSRWCAAWESRSKARGRCFAGNGNPITPELNLEPEAGADAYNPGVGYIGFNRFVFFYGAEGGDTFIQLISSLGVLKPPLKVNFNSSDTDRSYPAGGGLNTPLLGGAFYVTWAQKNGDNSDLFMRFYNFDSPLTDPILINHDYGDVWGDDLATSPHPNKHRVIANLRPLHDNTVVGALMHYRLPASGHHLETVVRSVQFDPQTHEARIGSPLPVRLRDTSEVHMDQTPRGIVLSPEGTLSLAWTDDVDEVGGRLYLREFEYDILLSKMYAAPLIEIKRGEAAIVKTSLSTGRADILGMDLPITLLGVTLSPASGPDRATVILIVNGAVQEIPINDDFATVRGNVLIPPNGGKYLVAWEQLESGIWNNKHKIVSFTS